MRGNFKNNFIDKTVMLAARIGAPIIVVRSPYDRRLTFAFNGKRVFVFNKFILIFFFIFNFFNVLVNLN